MNSATLDEQLRTQLRGDLLAASRRVPTRRHIIQTWELSSVERWFFPDGSSLICKIATTPFTGEATVLRALNNQQAPVPLLNGYAMRPDGLGMGGAAATCCHRTAQSRRCRATAVRPVPRRVPPHVAARQSHRVPPRRLGQGILRAGPIRPGHLVRHSHTDRTRLLTRLIHAYVAAGGHPDAEADRGGLPAARWALGWHRVWAAWWLLSAAAAGHHQAAADRRHTQVVLRQLQGALDLLGTPPPISASCPSSNAGRSS